jgi:hypothetical protein
MIAEALAKALGGRRAGAGWIACCSARDDHDPSLSIRDCRHGKVLVHCHPSGGAGRLEAIDADSQLGIFHNLTAAVRSLGPVRGGRRP